MSKTKRHTTTKEIVAIVDLLKLHVAPVPPKAPDAPPTCEYRGDWSDDKIAKSVAPDLNANHVQRFRVELYGQLAKPVLEEDRLTALEAEHHKLRTRFDTLCADLAGRGIDPWAFRG
jgi:hypothetical protein